MKPLFTGTLQIGLVVRDVEATARTYWDKFGIGPWAFYTFSAETISEMTIDGHPSPYAMRIAFADLGSVNWELIQPLDDKSIYSQFIRDRGVGLHHVAFAVRDYTEAIQALAAQGISVTQGGNWNGMTYAYLSTESDLHFTAEIYDWPASWVLPTPEACYPPNLIESRPPGNQTS